MKEINGNDIITMAKKILLIDDEPDVTYTIKKILEDNGFKVDSFNDPILALNYYKVNFYDLLILDIKMPKMDGFELYTKIREKEPKVKICFLTAIATFNEEFRKIRLTLGKTINEDYFIQKPINMEDLTKKLTSIMNI
ncbi:MAG TPA: response regulator [Nitrososphaeraceae archaeon]|jgi:DNA-binding response OmpR family regulator